MTDRKRKPRYCGGKKRQGTGTCTRPAGWGTDHPGRGRCKLHGGKTKSHAVKAQREEAAEAVVAYGLSREVDPHAALLEELHRTAGHVAWLQSQVAKLETEQLHGPVGGGVNSIPEEKPHIWLVLYQAERAHFTKVAKTCVDVGIEERRVQIAEQQGQLLAQVIRGVLTDLGVANHPEAPAVVRRHLTAIAGGAA